MGDDHVFGKEMFAKSPVPPRCKSREGNIHTYQRQSLTDTCKRSSTYPGLFSPCGYKHTFLTLHSEVYSLCLHPSFVYSDALIPARVIWGHSGHLQREVGQDVHLWVQTGILSSSQPGEVEADRANDVAGEESAGARRHGYIPLDCDGWRRLCRVRA